MVLERFLRWVADAPAQARADAARALVGACGTVGTDRQRTIHLDRMLSALLDDPSLLVRCALAEAAAGSVDVPRYVVVALSRDDSRVAVPVLRASCLLADGDLVDAVAVGDTAAQVAVASRAGVSGAVAAALVEIAGRDAVLALAANVSSRLSPPLLRRIVDRFGHDAEMREVLLMRTDLDPATRHDLVVVTAEALTAFAMSCAWMSPQRADCIKREGREKGAVTIAATSARSLGVQGPLDLAAHLRAIGHLTPALLLRSLLSGNLELFAAALSQLAGVSSKTAMGHLRSPMGLGFASLYGKAAMPSALLPVFCAALEAVARHGTQAAAVRSDLLRPAVTHVLQVCTRTENPEFMRVAALLRRFEAESLRDSLKASMWALEAPPVAQPMAGPALRRIPSVAPVGRVPLLSAA
ncbi:DUF2336 domain-containing protein [Lichenifustis flavocetrariae]|uniref:DUF2336 domain-containing protein n=1 Tax=Lichenifustis flavocetrariae TaxID=2949735 RepID=A0AA41YUL6_9HYPH|nr:DUF2336 domain-containing protein [Lichenifustis flavocetrariae]MCW6507620.1 DUF2336 domain-containing protein [Lichenifustis flavocetrariae]